MTPLVVARYLTWILGLTLIFFPSNVSSQLAGGRYVSYYNNRYEIKDLFKNGTCFSTYANMWVASDKASANQITACGDGYSILGGLGVLGTPGVPQMDAYFQRIYTGLRTHNMLFFTFTFYCVGSWDPSDNFRLSFDGGIYTGFMNIFVLHFYEDPKCAGSSSGLRNIRGFGNMQRSGSTLDFRVVSRMDEQPTNEGFGIREINFFFTQRAGTLPANFMCLKGPDDTKTNRDCDCPEGYWGSPGACTQCNSACASCWGATANECFQCTPGYSLIGETCSACPKGCSFCTGTGITECMECMLGWFLINNNQCVPRCDNPMIQGKAAYDCVNTCTSPCSATDFLYWDGTCLPDCPPPLRQSTWNGISNIPTCLFPCENGMFLHVDGTCQTTCDPPRRTVNMHSQQYCEDQCPVGQYLYWDQSCQPTCPYPLVQTPTHNQILCRITCAANRFLYWDGRCLPTCPFPLSTRLEKGYQFCDFPLEDVTLYLYYDGSSAASCLPPLSSRIEGSPLDRKFCDYLCADTQYLFSGGGCMNSCDFPLIKSVKGGKNFCTNPCTGTQSLYWDGTCQASCLPPYIPRIVPGINYCDYVCPAGKYYYWDGTCVPSCAFPLDNYTAGTEASQYCVHRCAAGEFLYWNKTCSSSCDFPLMQQTYKAKQFCTYPCSDKQFLFYNGTCADNCLDPFVERRENGYGFCEFPCSDYMLWNQTCIGSCPSPLFAQLGPYGEKYCILPCASPFKYYVLETGQCLTECDTGSVIENELFPICMWTSPVEGAIKADPGLIESLLTADGKSGTYSLIAPVKLSNYIRYLKVQQSPRLYLFTVSQARPILSLKFNIAVPESFGEYFKYETLPVEYSSRNNHLHSTFIVNYWNNLTTLLVVFGATLLIMIINFGVKNSSVGEDFKQTIEKIKIIFKWNFCVLLVTLNSDEIIFYMYLDFKTMVLNKGSSTVSLLVCLFMLALLLGILVTGFVLVLRRQMFRTTALRTKDYKKYDSFLYSWDGWQLVFRGIQDKKVMSRLFYLIYTVRFFLPSITMVAFMDYPVTQTVLQGLITFGIIQALLILNPIKNKASHIQLLIVETITFVINACSFFLAAFDHQEDTSIRARVLLGDLIILGNFCITMTMITFIPIKLGLEGMETWQARKMKQSKGSADWMRLLVIPLQQFAFGFEEMLPRNKYSTVYKNLKGGVNPRKEAPHHVQPSERQGLSFSDFKKEGFFDKDISGPVSLATTATAQSPSKKRLDRLRSLRNNQPQLEERIEEETNSQYSPNASFNQNQFFGNSNPKVDDAVSDNFSAVSINLSNVGLVGQRTEENSRPRPRRKFKRGETSEANHTREGFNSTFGREFQNDEPFPDQFRGSMMSDHTVSGFSNRPRRMNRSRSPDLEPPSHNETEGRGFRLTEDSPNNGNRSSITSMSPGRKSIKHRTQEMKSLFKLN